jgi:hypothetical protein
MVLIGELTQLFVKDGNDWKKVGKILNVDGPNRSRQPVEQTTFDDVGGSERFRMEDLLNNGELVVSAQFAPDDTGGQAKLAELFEGNDLGEFRLELYSDADSTDADYDPVFFAYVQDEVFSGMERRGNVQKKYTLKIDGDFAEAP